ncbi:DUF4307 domain-containing protein [Demequina sp. TTPB684]|uniref:DUF4307 domain-containing protein n=1 Tax=unclassified Demequina TaxID=2620311 RepID=UPI001CF195E2|nr:MULTISPECIES: DUF4307 domain-containing protein [unclassified Demequina]MCB2412524.1 DUF4307 domain-containing protein [Demequina sp. TTPB684]UPU87353.1 DUF4307 domain-containing protein [Demequina sp. TMPB413]
MSTDDFLEDDAPTRARLSTRAKWLIGVGLAALTAVSALWAWWIADQPVRWQEVGFNIASPTEASVTYDVFLYSDDAVTCHVQALNVRFAEVGVTTARIDPADGTEQRVTTTMATTEEATTAVVEYCEAD